ncbi:MAG TPA: TIGR01777 family oxidoreductase [Gemmatimonadaceae bacterium]|jgi:uncharacterized protein (TIGR01777 family)|nr:TIGR01777 family oxidoreductase [Gemmatimonadaceae bacterium]
MSMRVGVAGSSGFVGSALVPALVAAGHTVVRLARGLPDSRALDGIDAVVNLAGESVDERWTADRKRRIRTSRIETTDRLARGMAALSPRPAVFVSASAVGIYGNRRDEALDETSALGTGFLAEVGQAWEAAAEPARQAGIRTVHPRFGMILAAYGGALAKMLPAFRMGAGGKIASGTQWMSWIALDDVVQAIRFALETPALVGPANYTAPNPVTNADFTHALGVALRRPTVATIPPFALKLAYGEMAEEVLIAGQRVYPRALERAGYTFRYPQLADALRVALSARPPDAGPPPAAASRGSGTRQRT